VKVGAPLSAVAVGVGFAALVNWTGRRSKSAA
jgi:hypothetical protein